MNCVDLLKVEVSVCRDLVASRKAKYKGGNLLIVEESVRSLRKHGVRVQTWNELEVEPDSGGYSCSARNPQNRCVRRRKRLIDDEIIRGIMHA